MEYHVGPKIGKIAFVILAVLIIIFIIIITVNYSYLKIQYYIATFKWTEALETIDHEVMRTKDEVYRDQLRIYHVKIIEAMITGANELKTNSEWQLNEDEKIIFSKYQRIYNECLKDFHENLDYVKKIAEKTVPFQTIIHLPSVDNGWEYKKMTIAESDEFFRQIVGVYYYTDLPLDNVQKFFLNRIAYIKGVFTLEGLSKSVYYPKS